MYKNQNIFSDGTQEKLLKQEIIATSISTLT